MYNSKCLPRQLLCSTEKVARGCQFHVEHKHKFYLHLKQKQQFFLEVILDNEISATAPEDFPEEQALYEALNNVELEEGNELDEKLLTDFIIKQKELSESIYKK